jgi:hypothetical protein
MFPLCVPPPPVSFVLIFPSNISLAGEKSVTLGEEYGLRMLENRVQRGIHRSQTMGVNDVLERIA